MISFQWTVSTLNMWPIPSWQSDCSQSSKKAKGDSTIQLYDITVKTRSHYFHQPFQAPIYFETYLSIVWFSKLLYILYTHDYTRKYAGVVQVFRSEIGKNTLGLLPRDRSTKPRRSHDSPWMPSVFPLLILLLLTHALFWLTLCWHWCFSANQHLHSELRKTWVMR